MYIYNIYAPAKRGKQKQSKKKKQYKSKIIKQVH